MQSSRHHRPTNCGTSGSPHSRGPPHTGTVGSLNSQPALVDFDTAACVTVYDAAAIWQRSRLAGCRLHGAGVNRTRWRAHGHISRGHKQVAEHVGWFGCHGCHNMRMPRLQNGDSVHCESCHTRGHTLVWTSTLRRMRERITYLSNRTLLSTLRNKQGAEECTTHGRGVLQIFLSHHSPCFHQACSCRHRIVRASFTKSTASSTSLMLAAVTKTSVFYVHSLPLGGSLREHSHP
jgi:hypothetical protein